MTLIQIKYFLTVAHCLSFTKAANQLYVAQPALSRQIKKMEEELGVALFLRTTNGIRLTSSGNVMLVGLEEIYNRYKELVDQAVKIQKEPSGSLSVGILEYTNTSDFLPLICRDFSETKQKVQLKLKEGSFGSLMEGLHSGEFDIIFTTQFSVANRENIIYQYTTISKDYIIMSKYNPLSEKRSITLEDCKDELFVLLSEADNPESANLILEKCKECGFTPRTMNASSLHEIKLLVSNGLGITILDSRCDLLNNPDIKYFEMDSHWDPSIVAAWMKNNYNPLIEVFLKKMNEVLKLDNIDLHGESID